MYSIVEMKAKGVTAKEGDDVTARKAGCKLCLYASDPSAARRRSHSPEQQNHHHQRAKRPDAQQSRERTCIALNSCLELICSYFVLINFQVSQTSNNRNTYNYALFFLALSTNFGLRRITLTNESILCIGVPLRANRVRRISLE